MEFTKLFKYEKNKTESDKKKERKILDLKRQLKKRLEQQEEDIYIEDDWTKEFD